MTYVHRIKLKGIHYTLIHIIETRAWVLTNTKILYFFKKKKQKKKKKKKKREREEEEEDGSTMIHFKKKKLWVINGSQLWGWNEVNYGPKSLKSTTKARPEF